MKKRNNKKSFNQKRYDARQNKINELKKEIARFQAENMELKQSLEIARAANNDERIEEAISKAELARENYEKTMDELRQKKEVLDGQIKLIKKERANYEKDVNKFIKKAEKQQSKGVSLLQVMRPNTEKQNGKTETTTKETNIGGEKNGL